MQIKKEKINKCEKCGAKFGSQTNARCEIDGQLTSNKNACCATDVFLELKKRFALAGYVLSIEKFDAEKKPQEAEEPSNGKKRKP